MDRGMTCSSRENQLEQMGHNWSSGGALLQSPPKGGTTGARNLSTVADWSGSDVN